MRHLCKQQILVDVSLWFHFSLIAFFRAMLWRTQYCCTPVLFLRPSVRLVTNVNIPGSHGLGYFEANDRNKKIANLVKREHPQIVMTTVVIRSAHMS